VRFRHVVLAFMVPLLLGTVVATVGAVTIVLDRSARRELAAELDRSRQVFEQLTADRELLYRSESRVVAEEPRLKAVVATEDVTHETVLGVASELRRALQADIFLIADGHGRLLADTANSEAAGDDVTGLPLIARALAQGEASGIWRDERNAFQVQSRRLSFGATSVGVLAIGYRVDDRMVEAVERQTASAVVIELGDHPVAVSPFADLGGKPQAEALAAPLGAVPTGRTAPTEVSVAGTHYLAVAAPLSGAPPDAQIRYVILRSLDRALLPSRRLERALFGIGGAAVLAALLVAAGLSLRLSRPLDQLVAFTRRIALGDLGSRADIMGPREVVALAGAMNQMVRDLERHQEELAAKERLEKEMEIAARIQTSILPRSLAVRGLEVSALMRPATEVGGDYYDVIPTSGGCWVGIGDVAGHGLTAGLVMMMLQAVVAALCRRAPTAAPSDILEILNAVLHENIRHRLDHDEHVTLSLLRYDGSGRFVFAGAHEEIVVCRAQSGVCETVPTPGTWMGAIRSIKAVTIDSELELAPGDLMILYTDGVTEAMNDAGQQYGLQRLCAQVEAHRSASTEEIRNAVLADVDRFTRSQVDDVTLLVLRYEDLKA